MAVASFASERVFSHSTFFEAADAGAAKASKDTIRAQTASRVFLMGPSRR